MPEFVEAFPYQDDILALPVLDLDQAVDWYGQNFGMTEVSRSEQPVPSVILERDGVRVGFAINGGDAAQAGAAIRVTELEQIRTALERRGVNVSERRVDERDGKSLDVFFVVAPDGLCYYFHQPLDD